MSDDAYLYWYRATVAKVVDADTLDLLLDLGLSTRRNERVRLNRIDAWEVRGPERDKGKAASAWLSEQLKSAGNVVEVNTKLDKSGKYGRLLADIYIGNRCLNDELVSEGYAEYRSYD